jgi:HD-GYP domain-containing protein (c-di-GMP phosphodiesterase class II)
MENVRETIFELQNAILKTVAELVECRDSVTGGHIERTQRYLRVLVDAMKKQGVYSGELGRWDVNLFILASELHDVGKISIKDSILMKPGKLTAEEFDEMKKHAIYGETIIRNIEKKTEKNVFLEYARILAVSHHEKWDGSGYPLELKGDGIPLQGRLMAICDVYDALTHDRPYKMAYSHEDSVAIIKNGSGTHFDPVLCEIFLKHEKEFGEIASMNFDRYSADSNEPAGDSPVLTTIASIIDTRSGTADSSPNRMQHYLVIAIDALLKHKSYAKEVSQWDVDVFLLSAQLHDVGKIAISDDILNKTEELTKEEFEDIKSHTDFGVKVVNKIKESVTDEKLLRLAEDLVGSHHEKWDGTGYPLGLKGEEIPLPGRLMAIIDVYTAITADRPHRKRVSHQKAVNIIKGLSGTHFDPGFVKIFLENEKKFEKVVK